MPHKLRELSSLGRAYVLGVTAIGLLIAVHSLAWLATDSINAQWLILAALTLLTGSFAVRIPRINARLSVSDTFIFAAAVLFGPAAGTITAILDVLTISLRLARSYREPFRLSFNISVAAIATWASAHCYYLVSGIKPYTLEQTPLAEVLFPLFLFTLIYFLINSWLVTFALALEQRTKAYPIWRDNFLRLGINYFGGASVAALLVTYSTEIDFATLGIIVPLLLISYLTFKTSLGRIEDSNQHLLQVNKLYLSTIETLAMAIDAKDQITHGHIRRVQRLAVGLARALGVNDDTQIRAIEAAALLHDMGKLAIPEFILNKPGRLAPHEFEVMKQHANIGADILGAIQFPYPVVPIVRHHHEAWDGSGYPNGLKGVAIPLGARILSVADCFDALTSDRPYRPRLSVDDAVAVLLQRRGTMYDPLIVDKFIESQILLSELAEADDAEQDALDTIATTLRVTPEAKATVSVESDSQLPIKVLSLLRSIRPSPSGLSMENFGHIASTHLKKVTSFRGVAVYWTTESQHALRCRYADGPLVSLMDGPEIPIGKKLSGWVAAHRTAIWNSDAALDLPADVAKDAGIAMGSSVPLLDGDSLVGVLTFYSAPGKEISVEQRMLIQSIVPTLTASLCSAVAHDEVAAIDATSLRDKEAAYAVIDTLLSARSQWVDERNPDRLTLVRVSWPDTSLQFDRNQAIQALLQRGLSTATKGTGHVLRLSPTELLVVAPLSVLGACGLAPSPHRTARAHEPHTSEIVNSLQLREAMGLVNTAEPLTQPSRSLIH